MSGYVAVGGPGRSRNVTSHDDEPAVIGLLEAARAVRKPALAGGQRDERRRLAIVGSQALDAVSHFLSVGADVLDRSPTDGSRNAGQAFQAGQAARHTFRDDFIPRFSCANGHQCVFAVPRVRAATNVNVHDQTIKSRRPRSPGCCRRPARRTARAWDAAPPVRPIHVVGRLRRAANHRAGPPMPSVVSGASGCRSRAPRSRSVEGKEPGFLCDEC